MENEIIELLEQQGQVFQEFKTAQDKRLRDLEMNFENIEKIRNRPDIGGDRETGQIEFMDKDGCRIPCLTKGQWFQDLPEFRPESGQPASLGQVIHGLVTGDFKNVEKKGMGEQIGSTGGWLLSSPVSGYVLDMARANSVCQRAGSLSILMEGPELTVVRISSDPTGYWRGENKAITESEAGITPIKLKAMVLGCIVRTSVELVEDAPDFSRTIEGVISRSLGVQLDRAGLMCTGRGEPMGIYYTPGINERSIGTNGGYLKYSHFSYAIQDVMAANGTPTSAVFSPRTFGQVDRWADGVANPLGIPAGYARLQKFITTSIPDTMTQGTATDASCAIVGDFSALAFGIRNNIIIEATRTGGDETFSKLQVLIRAFLRADVAVLRPAHFSKITGIIPES